MGNAICMGICKLHTDLHKKREGGVRGVATPRPDNNLEPTASNEEVNFVSTGRGGRQ